MSEFGRCVSSEGSADHQEEIADEAVEAEVKAEVEVEAVTVAQTRGDALTSQPEVSGTSTGQAINGNLHTHTHKIWTLCIRAALNKCVKMLFMVMVFVGFFCSRDGACFMGRNVEPVPYHKRKYKKLSCLDKY